MRAVAIVMKVFAYLIAVAFVVLPLLVWISSFGENSAWGLFWAGIIFFAFLWVPAELIQKSIADKGEQKKARCKESGQRKDSVI